MPNQPASLENEVRHLTLIGWSTREIAKRLDTSQSTVVRTQQKINTGPHPILKDEKDEDDSPPERPPRHWSWRSLHPVGVLIAALLLISVISLTLAWTRSPAVPAQVTACVKYDPAGHVTGIAGGGGCPPGWKTVVLTPAS